MGGAPYTNQVLLSPDYQDHFPSSPGPAPTHWVHLRFPGGSILSLSQDRADPAAQTVILGLGKQVEGT